jgi:hypothetical protein
VKPDPIVQRISPPPLPGDVVACVRKELPPPKKGAMSKQDAFGYIAGAKAHDKRKTQCGNRLINLYESAGG